MNEEKRYAEAEAHEHFARTLNGEVWDLLGNEQRMPEEDERMVHAAHASHYHWLHAGSAVNWQRGEWLISHVYAELGAADPALRYARLCMQWTEKQAQEMQDFDRAYALEALARANAVAGNRQEALAYRKRAAEAGQAIAEAGDRRCFQADLKAGNWGKLN